VRLAVYNVENLFQRARVMNQDTWKEGKDVLKWHAELNELLGEVEYSKAGKSRMVALMKSLGLDKADETPFVILRRNRGELLRRPKGGGVEILAAGRNDWIGSLELIPEPIDEQAMRMTARVMRDVNADLLGVVEAESRPALDQFNRQLVAAVGGTPYDNVMLIDGNDTRGIDVGVCYREPLELDFIRTHVSERRDDGRPVFSRDCAEYRFLTPSGLPLLVMVNHFKSKGYGSPADNDALRKAQASRVRAIYDQRLADGVEYIAVIGDFNDTPDSAPLAPLHKGTSLQDIFRHPTFDDGGYAGTYGLCNATNKIDYLMLSPELFAAVTSGGVFRKGMWPGSRPARWEAYPELEEPVDAGSDHACVFMDFDI
jgi:endonuclease/exonuclease/phosphatase family metal-dependent hydrolase